MEFYKNINAAFENCKGCKALEVISLAGYPVCGCRNFQNPQKCKKREVANDK